MLTPPFNQHYVLECRRGPNVHYIPIPRPIPPEITANPRATTKAAKKVLVACLECGLVSAYSESDVQIQMSPRADPFEADVYRLVSLNIECGDKNCDTPRSVHTVVETERKTSKQKVLPVNWQYGPDCLCPTG